MDLKQFEQRIQHTSRPAIVELWAPWCGPCKMMEPSLKQAAQKYTGKVDLIRINADSSQEIVRHLKVFGIPTMIGYKDGSELFRKTGAQSTGSIEAVFERALLGEQKSSSAGSPGKLARILRLSVGVLLVAAGWFLGREWLLMAAGGVVLFSAVYDRCPIYQAVVPRIRGWIHK